MVELGDGCDAASASASPPGFPAAARHHYLFQVQALRPERPGRARCGRFAGGDNAHAARTHGGWLEPTPSAAVRGRLPARLSAAARAPSAAASASTTPRDAVSRMGPRGATRSSRPPRSRRRGCPATRGASPFSRPGAHGSRCRCGAPAQRLAVHPSSRSSSCPTASRLPRSGHRDATLHPSSACGGMALRNGLLVHGPTHWAAAIRARDGAIRVASGPKPRLAAPGTLGAPACVASCAWPRRWRSSRSSSAAPRGRASDAGPEDAGRDGRGHRRRGRPARLGRADPGARGRRGPAVPVPRAAHPARERAGLLPRRRAQGHRRLRARRGRGRCPEGARSLRLQPRGAHARGGRGGQRGRAPRGAARPARRRRRGAGLHGACRRGLRVVRAPRALAPGARAAPPGHEIQRLVGTREPRPSSSRWGAPRSTRSCGWRASPARAPAPRPDRRHDRPRLPHAPRPVRVPPAGRADPERLLHRRVLRLLEGSPGGRGSPPARDDAGVPARGVRAGRDRRGHSRPQGVRRAGGPGRVGAQRGTSSRSTRCTRATSSPRTRR